MTPLDIVLVAGARPNFMKIAPIYWALREHAAYHVRVTIVHTGQHYDAKMSDDFFRDLRLPAPDVNLEVGSASHAEQTARVMTGFERVLLERRPDVVVVVGTPDLLTGPARERRVDRPARRGETPAGAADEAFSAFPAPCGTPSVPSKKADSSYAGPLCTCTLNPTGTGRTVSVTGPKTASRILNRNANAAPDKTSTARIAQNTFISCPRSIPRNRLKHAISPTSARSLLPNPSIPLVPLSAPW